MVYFLFFWWVLLKLYKGKDIRTANASPSLSLSPPSVFLFTSSLRYRPLTYIYTRVFLCLFFLMGSVASFFVAVYLLVLADGGCSLCCFLSPTRVMSLFLCTCFFFFLAFFYGSYFKLVYLLNGNADHVAVVVQLSLR